MDVRPQNAVLFATIVVVNIIWCMLMIAAIGLGAAHLSDCPLQPYIPIYLIVLGTTSIVSLTVTYNCSINKDSAIHILGSVCMAILHIFSFAWLIAGTYWVYSVYPPNYSGNEYCKTTYQFAFVIITLLWVTMSLVVTCGCCFGLLTCSTTIFAGRHLLPNRTSFYGSIRHFQGSAAGDV